MPRRVSLHLVVSLSAHGFGHIGQVAPIVRALREHRPALRVTVRSRAPAAKLRERLGEWIDVQEVDTDVGMIQADALNVDIEATARAYADFHAGWARRVESEAAALRDLDADLLLANVPYLAVAGAARAGLRAVALCSLNWAGIYRYFYGDRGEAEGGILSDMLTAYGSALAFLQPEPSAPMPEIRQARPIGPLAQLGHDRRDELRALLGLPASTRIVVVSFGGMDRRAPLARWPRFRGMRLVVPGAWGDSHPDAVALEALPMPFADVMASCDALIAKPGYASFVEAACLGVPVLYVERVNWPEQAVLVQWLERHVPARSLGTRQLEEGAFRDQLEDLWRRPGGAVVHPTGVLEAAIFLSDLMG